MLQNQLWDSWNSISHWTDSRDRPQFWKRNEMTRQLRTSGQMLYALIDFSLAKRLEPGCDRLPCEESFVGPSYDYHPQDTAHGEYDYDPFAYDVGLLGYTFCRAFQHHIPSIPLLAPLFDGMINPRIERRFTAKQALDFLIARRAEMSSSELSAELPDATKYVDNKDNLGDTYDRWVGLPEEFVKKWAPLYKVRYPSMWTLFLRRICFNGRVYWAVAWIRRQWDNVFGRRRIRRT
ncbi:hypothetical protein AX16_008438 [Volvariella volvacea WC 439]|nr:hypothetical protein AX16_008438 [Volvariella volvacea WC 439]